VGAILGWAELGFEQSRNYPQISDRFARIREQAERAAALTRELLAFARRQILQPRSVDLNAITGDLASFLDKVIRKDLELKVVNAPLDALKADPTQIEQVLMNLCLNARDAMPQGGRLLIETEMVDIDDAYCRFYPHISPGRYAVLSVSDTGVGMDAEMREHVFEPFFSTKDNGKNSGMGLATAYGIVKQHGGFIHVYSEVGKGTLFRAYLPAAPGEPSEDFVDRRRAPSVMDVRGTETLLLADDHDSIREMARQTLVSLGYRVLSAVDGEEALRLCESEIPALAILDAAGVRDVFAAVVVSDQVGWRKPRPDIFRYALDAAGADPARTLFVGDKAELDVAGAHRVGMDAAWINPEHEPLPPEVRPPEYEIRDLSELEPIVAAAPS